MDFINVELKYFHTFVYTIVVYERIKRHYKNE